MVELNSGKSSRKHSIGTVSPVCPYDPALTIDGQKLKFIDVAKDLNSFEHFKGLGLY